MTRRVVITGCGVVSAAGTELTTFWRSLMSGACAIGPLQAFDVPELAPLWGAEVQLPAADRLPPQLDIDARRARCLELALAAARRALRDGQLLCDGVPTGVLLGTTLGEERQVGDLHDRSLAAHHADASWITRCNNQRLAACIAREHGLRGPAWLVATACSSGNSALALGYDLIADGELDRVLVVGADTLTRLIYCGFKRLGALSRSICRPFDAARDGVSFGEGAAALLLESASSAQERGARGRAELASYGESNDAHHVTAPGPHGVGFVRAIAQALERAGLSPQHVGYVSAHGTGTLHNDRGESEAMLNAFGDLATKIPISSIKSMLGHTNGAASAIEAVACTLALEHQQLPPTANFSHADPGLALDYVPRVGRNCVLDTCLSLAAGFGGHNVCLALRRVPCVRERTPSRSRASAS
ncbi:MAG TPA: beta-ketoacyl-[acyl-carrier-protein] synthase family protein [Polyangiales bacterium]